MPIATGRTHGAAAASVAAVVVIAVGVAVGWQPWRDDTRHVAQANVVSSVPAAVTDSDATDVAQNAAIYAAADRIALPPGFSSSETFFGRECGADPWMNCWTTASDVQAAAGEIAKAIIVAGMPEPETQCESACSVAVTVKQGSVFFIVAPNGQPNSSGSAIYEALMTTVSADERTEAAVMFRQRMDLQIAAGAVAVPKDFTPIAKFGVSPCLSLIAWFACWSTPVSPRTGAEQMSQAIALTGFSPTTSCANEDGCDVYVNLPEGQLWIGLRREGTMKAQGFGPGSRGCEVFASTIPKLQEQVYGGGSSATPSV